jgi:tryptophan 2,3-dioxygenase
MSCPFKRDREDDDNTEDHQHHHHHQREQQSPTSAGSVGFHVLGFQAANPNHFLQQPAAGAAADSTGGAATSPDGRPLPTHYGTYLGIETLLRLQDGPAAVKEGGKGLVHHEELTFIIVHQVFELWFKLATADLIKVRRLLLDMISSPSQDGDQAAPAVKQPMPDKVTIVNLITQCVTYLRRSETILNHAQGAFAIMETMHPADFIEFRDYLVPASGFQSVAFRSLEQLLGVPYKTRALVNGADVFSYLHLDEQKQLADEGKLPSLHAVVTRLLCRVKVPESFTKVYLEANKVVLEQQQYDIARAPRNDPKAKTLIENGVERMQQMLSDPVPWSDGLVLESDNDALEYKKAVLAALFVISYRHENIFAPLASLLDALIATEEGLLLWRGRHLHMAERMIGRRSGTGGTSSGVGYLDVTRRYRIFHALWLVRKLFIRASALPALSTYGIDEGHLFE